MASRKGLTIKQFLFAEGYLETLNATEAARRAGYKGNDNVLAGVGHDNLRKPKIRTYIDERLKEKVMSAEEALTLLSQQAKGVDVTQFVEMREFYERDDQGDLVLADERLHIDLDKIREMGLGHLIKGISQTSGGIRVQWVDPQKALELMGRYHKLFTDRVEHSGSVETKMDDERFDRAISSLADALRESVPGKGDEPEGSLDSTE